MRKVENREVSRLHQVTSELMVITMNAVDLTFVHYFHRIISHKYKHSIQQIKFVTLDLTIEFNRTLSDVA